MNSSEKRYRVQIQFDVYADSDKEAIKSKGWYGLFVRCS